MPNKKTNGGQLGNSNSKGNTNYLNLTVRGSIALSEGKKNTQACIEAIAKRTTFVSLDGGKFKPFSLIKITDMRTTKEIRVYGEFSQYQSDRTALYHDKIRFVDKTEWNFEYHDPTKIKH